MSCRRSLEVELSDFLRQPATPAFDAFRDHYPRCAECSAEVRAWTELHERLATGGAAPDTHPGTHPDVEQLVRYERLGRQERSAVDAHLAGCPACREELAQLQSFDPARLAALASGPEAAHEAGGLRRFLEGLRGVLWHPAFAYALVGLLLFPAIYRSVAPRPAPVEEALLLSEAGPLSEADAVAVEPLPSLEADEPEPVPRAEAERLVQAAQAAPTVAEKSAVPAPAELNLARAMRHREPLADVEEAPAGAPGRREIVASDANEAEGAPLQRRGASRTRAFAAKSIARADTEQVRLEPDRMVEVAVAGKTAELVLRAPVPDASPGGRGELRIVSASGRRELREQGSVPPPSPGVREFRAGVPSAWLRPGVYRIELVFPDDPETPPSKFTLRVR